MDIIVEIFHASKFGNGARVAEELKRALEAKGARASVHHIDEARPREMPPADLYVFGSPTRMGKPPGGVRRFLKKVALPSGTRYAVFATHGADAPDKKTGRMPTEEEMARWRRTIPVMDEILGGKGLVKVADKMFFVSPEGLKGPLMEGWEARVGEFADRLTGPIK